MPEKQASFALNKQPESQSVAATATSAMIAAAVTASPRIISFRAKKNRRSVVLRLIPRICSARINKMERKKIEN